MNEHHRMVTGEKERAPLTDAKNKRQKCSRCHRAMSTMLHWRAYDLGIIPWPDVCQACWEECQKIIERAGSTMK